jgi:hypothetical protein
MKAYKEDDTRIKKFCDDFETAIVHPRVLIGYGPLKSISVEGVRYCYIRRAELWLM